MLVLAALHAKADHLHEIRVQTSYEDGAGMASFFGQLSIKVNCVKK